MQTTVDELATKGQTARIAARQLAKTGGGVRTQALLNVADSLESNQDEILQANEHVTSRTAGTRGWRRTTSTG